MEFNSDTVICGEPMTYWLELKHWRDLNGDPDLHEILHETIMIKRQLRQTKEMMAHIYNGARIETARKLIGQKDGGF